MLANILNLVAFRGPNREAFATSGAQEGSTECHICQVVKPNDFCIAVENGVLKPGDDCKEIVPADDVQRFEETRSTESFRYIDQVPGSVRSTASVRTNGELKGKTVSARVQKNIIPNPSTAGTLCPEEVHSAETAAGSQARIEVKISFPFGRGRPALGKGEAIVRLTRFTDLQHAETTFREITVIFSRRRLPNGLASDDKADARVRGMNADGEHVHENRDPLIDDDPKDPLVRVVTESAIAQLDLASHQFRDLASLVFEGEARATEARAPLSDRLHSLYTSVLAESFTKVLDIRDEDEPEVGC
jgi:hypothetical protein